MKLRNRPTFIRTAAEQQGQRKKVNLDKYIYITVLLLIILFAVVRFGRAVALVTGSGQVILSKLEVQHLYNIRVLYMAVEEGRQVRRGDILFTYYADDGGGDGTDVRIKVGGQRNKTLGDIQGKQIERAYYQKMAGLDKAKIAEELKCKKDERAFCEQQLDSIDVLYKNQLATKKRERDFYAAKLAEDTRQYEKMQKLVLLETYLPSELRDREEGIQKSRLLVEKLQGDVFAMETTWEESRDKYTLRVQQLTMEIRMLEWMLKENAGKNAMEVARLSQEIRTLGGQMNTIDTVGTRAVGGYGAGGGYGTSDFISPVDGMVTKLYYEPNEVVLKGQTIMDINQQRDMTIKTFFEQSDVEYVIPNRLVHIEFPDGKKADGYIARVYFATLPQPPEIQKKYEPTRRNIVADVVPINWSPETGIQFYKMNVRVSLNKFFPEVYRETTVPHK